MKKIAQLITILFSLTNCWIIAATQFSLTNKSSSPIWISGYADGDLFTGEDATNAEEQVLPNETFSANPSAGIMELTISIVEPGTRSGLDKYQTYKTVASANNKDKILVWNHTKHPKKPLYPESDTRLMGLIKTSIDNNIRQTELNLISYKNL